MNNQTFFDQALTLFKGVTDGHAGRQIINVGTPRGRPLLVNNSVFSVVFEMCMPLRTSAHWSLLFSVALSMPAVRQMLFKVPSGMSLPSLPAITTCPMCPGRT